MRRVVWLMLIGGCFSEPEPEPDPDSELVKVYVTTEYLQMGHGNATIRFDGLLAEPTVERTEVGDVYRAVPGPDAAVTSDWSTSSTPTFGSEMRTTIRGIEAGDTLWFGGTSGDEVPDCVCTRPTLEATQFGATWSDPDPGAITLRSISSSYRVAFPSPGQWSQYHDKLDGIADNHIPDRIMDPALGHSLEVTVLKCAELTYDDLRTNLTRYALWAACPPATRRPAPGA